MEIDCRKPDCGKPDYGKPDYGKPDCGEVKATTLPLCHGNNITPTGIKTPVIAKIPVVLAEKDIQVDIEAEIKLTEPIFEIKRIKKDVVLNQCKLLPRAGAAKNDTQRNGKLFISGFVRKNIEYATANCTEKGIVRGEIKHITVDVPFTCVTEVEFVTPPTFNFRSMSRQAEFLCNRPNDCFECEGEFMGKSPCEFDFEEVVVYNEKPFCELESARIFEEDLLRDCREIHERDYREMYERDCKEKHETKVCNKIIQKMVVFVRVKVLQLQQVSIGC